METFTLIKVKLGLCLCGSLLKLILLPSDLSCLLYSLTVDWFGLFHACVVERFGEFQIRLNLITTVIFSEL